VFLISAGDQTAVSHHSQHPAREICVPSATWRTAAKRVLILLTDKNEGTIAEACKVLKDIGTDKSLQPLTTLGRRATVAKKPKIAKAAQQAIEAIQARK